MTEPRRCLVVALAFSAVLTGCGLKAEPGPGSAPLARKPGTSGSSASPSPSAGAATPPPSPDATAPVVVGSAGASAAARPAGSTAPSSTAAPGSTVGVDNAAKTLRVAVHGSAAVADGARAYWERSGPNGGPRRVLGYRVVVEHLDDRHGSSDPARDCEVAARSAFLLVAAAGPDPMRACAQSRLLRRDGVPYLAIGAADTGLTAFPNSFATSLTFRQQAPLVVRVARDNGYLDTKWAVVVGEGPSLADARASAVTALTAAKVAGRTGAFDEERDVYAVDRTTNNCVELGSRLRDGGYGAVYVVGASPLLYGQCVNQHPSAVYTGVGPSWDLAATAELACRGAGDRYRGLYLDPMPDPQKARTLAPGAPVMADDALPGWATMQQLEQALALVQGPLGRASFASALAKAGTRGGVLNPTSYRSGTRFGGTAAYANRITCTGDKALVRTIGTYRA